MGSHSICYHSPEITHHKWTRPAKPQPLPDRLVLDLPIQRGERLSWPRWYWLVTYRDGLPVMRQSSIQVVTGPDVEQLRWSRPTLTITPRRHTDGSSLFISWALFHTLLSVSSVFCQSLVVNLRYFISLSFFFVLARDSIYAIASVCLSVCPSHGWISQRPLKLGSRNLHHRVSPWL